MDRLFMLSWYHGRLGRQEADQILLHQRPGLFLVRDSSTLQGGYVLSVSENRKVSHYIITQRDGQYQIGDQTFADLPEIVDFYRRHFLDTTTLVEAAPRQNHTDTPHQQQVSRTSSGTGSPAPPPVVELKVKAKYNFPGNDPDDLPFNKNDILTILEKVEEEWWMARDCTGKEGMIPVNYVEVISGNRTSSHNPTRVSRVSTMSNESTSSGGLRTSYTVPSGEVTVPAIAEAIQDRNPIVYDPTELKFEKGDRILVLKMLDSGVWDGQLKDGRTGTFPFRYVRVVTSDADQVAQFKSQMS